MSGIHFGQSTRSKPAFTCSKLTIETLEPGVNNKDTKTTPMPAGITAQNEKKLEILNKTKRGSDAFREIY